MMLDDWRVRDNNIINEEARNGAVMVMAIRQGMKIGRVRDTFQNPVEMTTLLQ